MKHCVLLALLFSANATAQPLLDDHDIQTCEAVSTLAGSVMLARQTGMSRETLIEIGQRNIDRTNPIMRELGLAVVEDAYRAPVVPSPEGKHEVSRQFQERYFDLCTKAARANKEQQ